MTQGIKNNSKLETKIIEEYGQCNTLKRLPEIPNKKPNNKIIQTNFTSIYNSFLVIYISICFVNILNLFF